MDTAHAIITPDTTREQLYVAATRARHATTLHTATDTPDEAHQDNGPTSACDVLTDVLARTSAPLSAVATIRHEQDQAVSLRQRVAEYTAIASLPGTRRHHGPNGRPATVVGITPAAVHPDPQVQAALDERHDLITHQADQLAATALHDRPAWTRHLHPQPASADARARWHQAVATIAAYRDLHGITSLTPLGTTHPRDLDPRDIAAALPNPTTTTPYNPPHGLERSSSPDIW